MTAEIVKDQNADTELFPCLQKLIHDESKVKIQ
jgi:hypothetical protein